MKAFGLRRVTPPPPPPEPVVCVACKAFRAEAHVPVGEGSAPMCWICAHHVVEHDCPLHETAEARCECTPDAIYPDRYFVLTREQFYDRVSFGLDSGTGDTTAWVSVRPDRSRTR